MADVRAEFRGLSAIGTTLIPGKDGELVWWTFAGPGANASLGAALTRQPGQDVAHESFCLTIPVAVTIPQFHAALQQISGQPVAEMLPKICEQLLQRRNQDVVGIEHTLRAKVTLTAGQEQRHAED